METIYLTDTKLSKTQMFKIIQSKGFLGLLLSQVAVPLTKVSVLLAQNILAPLEKTATASAIHLGTQN